MEGWAQDTCGVGKQDVRHMLGGKLGTKHIEGGRFGARHMRRWNAGYKTRCVQNTLKVEGCVHHTYGIGRHETRHMS